MTPVPVRLTLSGLDAAFVFTLKVAARPPDVVGVKVREYVQEAFTASDPLQVVENPKSPGFEPPIVAVLTVSDAVPVFVRITTCGFDDEPTV